MYCVFNRCDLDLDPMTFISELDLDMIKTYYILSSCDLDLDPMTLILELELDTIKIYQYTKDEVPNSMHLKVMA